MPQEVPQRRYDDAYQAGRNWAAQQLELAGEMDVTADFEGTLPEAAAGFVALQTGQLPSLFFANLAQRQLEIDMSSEFQAGASEVLAETSRSRVNGTPSPLDADASSDPSWQEGQDGTSQETAGTGSLVLAQIAVEGASLEDCVAHSVQALRDMARRIEAGEKDGTIFDDEGHEVGAFEVSSGEHE